MHMMRLIRATPSKLIPQRVMNPTTPISIETMLKLTHKEQTTLQNIVFKSKKFFANIVLNALVISKLI